MIESDWSLQVKTLSAGVTQPLSARLQAPLEHVRHLDQVTLLHLPPRPGRSAAYPRKVASARIHRARP